MKNTGRGSAPYTGPYLKELRRLDPDPTGCQPRLDRIPDIGAVFFDVYGTLLISASGDVDVAEFKAEAVVQAIRDGSVEILAEPASRVGDMAIEFLIGTIKEEHSRLRSSGIPSPEVDIVEVWRTVLVRLEDRGMVKSTEATDPVRLSLRFELLANPVYPMPGLHGLLEDLRSRGLVLGLVSNAQFFTPVVLDYFVNSRVPPDGMVPGGIPPFAQDLTFFSFQYRRAKPDPFLFGLAKRGLTRHGISSGQTLYVGNDMLNDVWAAHEEGFRTVLFAGDARSLRWREDHSETKDLLPDAIITSLSQLPDLL